MNNCLNEPFCFVDSAAEISHSFTFASLMFPFEMKKSFSATSLPL